MYFKRHSLRLCRRLIVKFSEKFPEKTLHKTYSFQSLFLKTSQKTYSYCLVRAINSSVVASHPSGLAVWWLLQQDVSISFILHVLIYLIKTSSIETLLFSVIRLLRYASHPFVHCDLHDESSTKRRRGWLRERQTWINWLKWWSWCLVRAASHSPTVSPFGFKTVKFGFTKFTQIWVVILLLNTF